MQLGIIPALPALGFVLLLLCGSRLSRLWIAMIGVGSIASACIAAAVAGYQFFVATPDFHAYREILWTWIPFYSTDFDTATIQFAFYLDSLSMLMTGVVTFVATLIALFSVQFMDEDEDLARFFASMNLFVAAMLVLVLADNYLLLYMGWEGVGLCSYLLIGFWYQNPATGHASMKAFITTRVGDVVLLFGLFIIFHELGSLNIQEVLELAPQHWPNSSTMVTIAAFCLLGGAVGKSAQLPLQTWLPDAMLGPTPVSALIHAATMVTAGVYLIARSGGLFALAPAAQMAVMIVGAATLLLAGFSALAQTDLKRVLAYSTVSQIGYMFLALGAGAYSAAMFHFMSHAFFKALLFLSAGVIGYAMHHEYGLFKMGDLRRQLPYTFWVFLIGSACLSALPFITSGFYSKEFILGQTFASPYGGMWPWLAGVLGAFLTGLYTFRMVFIAFFGTSKGHVTKKPGLKMMIPLAVLSALALIAGFVQTPEVLGGISLFGDFIDKSVLASPAVHEGDIAEWMLLLIASVASVGGIALSYVLFLRKAIHEKSASVSTSLIHRFLLTGFGFDVAYNVIFVRPYIKIAQLLRRDLVQAIYSAMSLCALLLHRLLSLTQTGHLRHYAFVLACGGLIIVLIMVFS